MDTPSRNPRVLIVTPEVTYLPDRMGSLASFFTAKAGGLADVSAALVSALLDQGADVHVALPDYRSIFSDRLVPFLKEEINSMQRKMPDDRVHLAEDRAFFYIHTVYSDYGVDNLKIALAFVITGIGGYLVHESGVTLPDTLGPVTWAILLGGLAFILIERWLRGRPFTSQVTWTIAIIVAVGQLLAAVFPGVSRSGATIMLMLVMGLSRPASVEFSFLVGIPTMLAAGGFKIYKELVSPVPGAPPEQWDMVLLGFIVSAIVSFVVVKWLLHYVRNHTFEIFGWYRVGLFVVLFAMLYI